jgi:hypothetical protein
VGARRPGSVGVLATRGGYRRSSGILGDLLDMVMRPNVEGKRGEGVEVRRGRHGHVHAMAALSWRFLGMGLV